MKSQYQYFLLYQMDLFYKPPPNLELGINVLSLYRSPYILNDIHVFLWWKLECTFFGWSGSYHTYCIIYLWLCMNEWVKLKQSRVCYKLLRTEHINGGWCHNIRKLSIGEIFEDRNGIRLINNSVCAPFVIEQQRWFDSCALQIFVFMNRIHCYSHWKYIFFSMSMDIYFFHNFVYFNEISIV